MRPPAPEVVVDGRDPLFHGTTLGPLVPEPVSAPSRTLREWT